MIRQYDFEKWDRQQFRAFLPFSAGEFGHLGKSKMDRSVSFLIHFGAKIRMPNYVPW